jgi:hypothetical protein
MSSVPDLLRRELELRKAFKSVHDVYVVALSHGDVVRASVLKNRRDEIFMEIDQVRNERMKLLTRLSK